MLLRLCSEIMNLDRIFSSLCVQEAVSHEHKMSLIWHWLSFWIEIFSESQKGFQNSDFHSQDDDNTDQQWGRNIEHDYSLGEKDLLLKRNVFIIKF